MSEGQEYLVRGVGRFTTISDIGAVVVRAEGQTPVLVRDLATVQEGSIGVSVILMTALALVPIAMSMGEAGSEIQAPMALVILFGPASSTVLNMVVVPALYAHFGRPVAANRGTT